MQQMNWNKPSQMYALLVTFVNVTADTVWRLRSMDNFWVKVTIFFSQRGKNKGKKVYSFPNFLLQKIGS